MMLANRGLLTAWLLSREVGIHYLRFLAAGLITVALYFPLAFLTLRHDHRDLVVRNVRERVAAIF